MHFFSHFQNESYIPQLFTRQFSSGEPKCFKEVTVGDSNGLTTHEIAPSGVSQRILQNLYKILTPRDQDLVKL